MEKESKQVRYQRKHRAEGLCPKCPRKSVTGGGLCRLHAKKKRLAMRTSGGFNAWRKGGKGRPPIS